MRSSHGLPLTSSIIHFPQDLDTHSLWFILTKIWTSPPMINMETPADCHSKAKWPSDLYHCKTFLEVTSKAAKKGHHP